MDVVRRVNLIMGKFLISFKGVTKYNYRKKYLGLFFGEKYEVRFKNLNKIHKKLRYHQGR